jgi:predicted Zn-dependent peptidase
VADEITAAIARMKKDGIAAEDFERSRRKLYGRMIMMYNDVDDLANELAATFFTGAGLFDELEVCKGLDLATIQDRLQTILCETGRVLSVIKPLPRP